MLDAGVDGVVVPRIERAEEAEALVARLRYLRAAARLRPAAGREYGRPAAGAPGAGSRPSCRSRPPGALAAIAAIAATPGVDALVVGLRPRVRAGRAAPARARALAGAVHATESRRPPRGLAFGLAGGGRPAGAARAPRRAPDLLVCTRSTAALRGRGRAAAARFATPWRTIGAAA